MTNEHNPQQDVAAETQAISSVEETNPLDAIADSVLDASGQEAIIVNDVDQLPEVVIDKTNEDVDIVKRDAYAPSAHVTITKPIVEEGKKSLDDETGIVGLTAPGVESTNYYIKREIERLGLRSPKDYIVVAGFPDQIEPGVMDKTIDREGADWGQGVRVVSGDIIAPARPKIALRDKGDQPYDGNEITTMVRSRLGIGSTIVMPLWHTGIHITIKAPSDPDLFDLQQRIADETLEAARETGGLIYTINGAIMMGTFIEAILDHVIDCTLLDWDRVKLRDVIDHRDHQAMAYGMALTLYPSGFNYVDPCLNIEGSCDYVFEGRINLGRSWLEDRNALTSSQKEFMANRTKKRTLEEIAEYKQGGVVGQTRILNVRDSGIQLNFRHPTLDQHITSSSTIINNLREAASNMLGLNVEPNVVDNYVNRKLEISELLRIANYIGSIIIDDKESTSLPTIVSVLETLSSDKSLTKEILDTYHEFTNNTMVALMAIPRMQCPKCQHLPDPQYPNHPEVVPQDAVARFFTLVGQKMQ